MRRALIGAAGVLVLLVANIGIYQKQRLVDSGRVVMLELAPVDPRSLMQGDYMALRFRAVNDAFLGGATAPATDGRLVLALDERAVGTFVRFDGGEPLGPQEVPLRFRVRSGVVSIATNAYFYQEGTAGLYVSAKFGEFRVSPAGDAILVRLRDEKLELLGPQEPR